MLSDMKKPIKRRLVIPICIYADWKYCWQRNTGKNHTYWVDEYGKPDPKECAACLGALINWGQGATRRPLEKTEVKKEREEYKNETKSV